MVRELVDKYSSFLITQLGWLWDSSISFIWDSVLLQIPCGTEPQLPTVEPVWNHICYQPSSHSLIQLPTLMPMLLRITSEINYLDSNLVSESASRRVQSKTSIGTFLVKYMLILTLEKSAHFFTYNISTRCSVLNGYSLKSIKIFTRVPELFLTLPQWELF